MDSLQARLGLHLALALLVVFLVLWILVSSAITDVAEDYVFSRLEHDSETLLSALSFDRASAPVIDQTRIDSIYQRPFSGHYYQIAIAGAVVRSRSLWDQQLTYPRFGDPGTARLHITGPQQQPLLAIANRYRKQQQDVTIIVAEDLTAIKGDIKAFQNRFTLTAVLMLALLLVLSVFSVRQGLRPLRRVSQEVVALERGERRQLDVDVPREIKPLVSEVNRLLQMLNARLKRSRDALGDLAHALKKPLTILQQLQREESIQRNNQTRQTLTNQVQSMQQIIERQLRRARLAGESLGGMYFNAATEIPPLVEALEKIHREKSLQIITGFPQGGVIAVDREDMLELLGNLLDNACKWAHHRVQLLISVTSGTGEVTIAVEDDGEGVPDNELAELSRRGKRLDEAVSGHGLGLAIVRDIVDSYHGEIAFSRSGELGGLQVLVTLQSASDRIADKE